MGERQWLWKILETRRKILLILVGIAIEYIDVHIAANAPDASFRGELPVEQVKMGNVFAVARYPHIVGKQFG